MDKKQALFEQMLEWSKRENSYSLKDFAKEVGIPYDDLLAISKEDEELGHLFEMSRCHLVSHSFDALNSRIISDYEGLRYCYENGEFDEVLIDEGDDLPPGTEEAFNQWFNKQWKKDKSKYGFS